MAGNGCGRLVRTIAPGSSGRGHAGPRITTDSRKSSRLCSPSPPGAQTATMPSLPEILIEEFDWPCDPRSSAGSRERNIAVRAAGRLDVRPAGRRAGVQRPAPIPLARIFVPGSVWNFLGKAEQREEPNAPEPGHSSPMAAKRLVSWGASAALAPTWLFIDQDLGVLSITAKDVAADPNAWLRLEVRPDDAASLLAVEWFATSDWMDGLVDLAQLQSLHEGTEAAVALWKTLLSPAFKDAVLFGAKLGMSREGLRQAIRDLSIDEDFPSA